MIARLYIYLITVNFEKRTVKNLFRENIVREFRKQPEIYLTVNEVDRC